MRGAIRGESMSDENPTAPSISIGELADLRAKTEAVASLLGDELAGHLQTIRPLASPRQVLGSHVRGGSANEADHGDRAFDQLKEQFSQVAGKPFALPKEIVEDPISIEGKLEIHPWEYSHKLDDGKVVMMTSPLRWILCFHSGYSPSELRGLLAAKASRRTDDVRQFVTSALALQMLLSAKPSITRLISDLRFEISTGPADGFGALPIVSIGACVPSFRPEDELIRTATQFSGVSAFIELIDLESLRNLRDPLRDQIESAI
jgi:hypothetical protein